MASHRPRDVGKKRQIHPPHGLPRMKGRKPALFYAGRGKGEKGNGTTTPLGAGEPSLSLSKRIEEKLRARNSLYILLDEREEEKEQPFLRVLSASTQNGRRSRDLNSRTSRKKRRRYHRRELESHPWLTSFFLGGKRTITWRTTDVN